MLEIPEIGFQTLLFSIKLKFIDFKGNMYKKLGIDEKRRKRRFYLKKVSVRKRGNRASFVLTKLRDFLLFRFNFTLRSCSMH